jgi:uncharacterized protein (TIGR02594 family)
MDIVLKLLTALSRLLAAFFHHEGSAPPTPPRLPYEPPWVMVAKGEIGFEEKPGNRGIQKYTGPAECGSEGDPWCAVFVNAILAMVGLAGTRSAMARSFARSKHFKELPGPAIGCITVMWRGSREGESGHVFFYMGENDNGIVALGGNQKNKVCLQYEPKNRILGYYWPITLPTPPIGAVYAPTLAGITEGSET